MSKDRPNDAALARLKARMALPERAPDEAFVARVALEAEALALEAQAKRERRGQLAVDMSAAAALLVAARELGTTAESAASVLPAIGGDVTALAFLCSLVLLLVAALSAATEASGERGGG